MRRKKIETNISFKQTEIIFYLILPQSYNDDDDMVEGYKWHHYTKIRQCDISHGQLHNIS